MEQRPNQSEGTTSRRSFLGKSLAVGAGAVGAGLLTGGIPALAQEDSGGLTQGDAAILRFLAALEIIEADLWQQYNELGGVVDGEVPGGTVSTAYANALQQLDGDMPQYIHDNTDDEYSHFKFINAYLMSKDVDPINLDHFRIKSLSSKATGAQQIGRLTNLKELTVDTTWWTRYRSDSANPDLGGTFQQAVPDLSKGRFPAIPRDDSDLAGSTDTQATDLLQAIANTAGFHFGFIEQGGTSLYPSLAQRVTSPEVLRILLSIGPSETMHFQTWHDKAGNAKLVTVRINGQKLEFPDLNKSGSQDTQTNLIMPEPTVFLRGFPRVSIIRPTATQNAAIGAVTSLVDDGLFRGQSPDFVAFLTQLARAADAARHEH